MAKGETVRVGDPAPDFTLRAQSGETVHLGDFVGKSEVVLFFYPKDNTAICTAQACSFRDSYEAFRDLGAEVFGISGDSEESHRRFAARRKLPYPLLTDDRGAVRALYGVPKTFGLLPGRVTVVIDRQGIVRHVFSAPFAASTHVDEALKVLRSLCAEK